MRNRLFGTVVRSHSVLCWRKCLEYSPCMAFPRRRRGGGARMDLPQNWPCQRRHHRILSRRISRWCRREQSAMVLDIAIRLRGSMEIALRLRCNVDVACCMLESCGRYLYRLPHTNKKLNNIMETMQRLSKAKVRSEQIRLW